jgi:CheY-like chemotaxis protein
MNDEIISLRILLFVASAAVRDLMRRGAGVATIPVDATEAETAAAARARVADEDFDVVLVDALFPAADRDALIAKALEMKQKPFVFLMAASVDEAQDLSGDGVDGTVVKPENLTQGKALIERFARLQVPNRVLVVDDSLTMRSIVRKILIASRFRLEISEAQEGLEAIKQIGTGKFDLVFLDYNMPGLNGVETLIGIKRQSPNLRVVIMTSAADEILAERARRAGAAAFLRKPFYPADIDAVLHRVFGLRVPPR